MTDAEKLHLIDELTLVCVCEDDLRAKNSFGDDLVEIVRAIACEFICELREASPPQRDFYYFLIEHFSATHAVWEYVELVID